MSTPRLYAVFEYLAMLIAEREANEPFMLSQLQPAIKYKFPDFSFEAYEIPGLKEFLQTGEKAGYFKLVNMGSMQTSYLAPGTKQPQQPSSVGVQPVVDTSGMGANDPRRTQWMTLAMENMLNADRGDQILDAIKNVDALTSQFDQFLGAQVKTAVLYSTRGKLKRLREFLNVVRTKGQAQALASWQASRTMLRMPPVPPIEGAGQAQTLLNNILQGRIVVERTSIDELDNMFLAVLNFMRDQMTRSKSWDWVEGLNLLEAEVRAIPRPEPPAPKKQGLFGGKQETPPPPRYLLDESKIKAITQQLHQAAGAIRQSQDETPIWQGYVQTPSLDTMFKYLADRPKLVENDRMMAWLEDEIGQNVMSSNIEAVRNLANKAALIIAIRQAGFDGVRQNPGELKTIYESVMEGAKLLNYLFTFINAQGAENALQYYERTPALADETMGELFESQLLKAARQDDVDLYRRASERFDLWHNLVDFGKDEGFRQHQRFLQMGRDDDQIQAEMGLLLLGEAQNAEDRQDIIGRYPSVASDIGLNLANNTLEMLSFQKADPEIYNKHYDIKRLIERCLELGVDRALAELK